MAVKVADRVLETTNTTGTGSFTLLGTSTGFVRFRDGGILTGEQVYYVAEHPTLDEWEVGVGTLTIGTPDVLARVQILSSSNAGSAVSFSPGRKRIRCTLPAEEWQNIADLDDQIAAIEADIVALATGKSDVGHTHTIANVTGLQTALDGKAAVSHTHAIGDLPVATSGTSSSTQLVRADDSRLSNARTPTAHSHVIADVTGLQTALDGKAAVSHTHVIADLPVATSGTSSSTQLVRADDSRLSNARTPTAHSHVIADLPVATSGTSSSTQLVRADDSRLSNARTPTAHTHGNADITDVDASKLTGTIDPARLPVLPSSVQIVSSGAISALTAPQQAEIGDGSIVTTTDGRRWIYTGSGSKTLEASYIELADITPEWTAVANKPSTFTPSAHSHVIADLPVATSGTSSSTQVVRADDSRLSNARTPTAHTHVAADITDVTLQANLGTASTPTFYSANFTGSVAGNKAANFTNTSTNAAAQSSLSVVCGSHSLGLNVIHSTQAARMFLPANGLNLVNAAGTTNEGSFGSQKFGLPVNAGTPTLDSGRSYLWSDGSGRPFISNGTSSTIDLARIVGLIPTTLKTSNYTAASGEFVPVRAPGTNTAGASATFTTLTVTLPASPSAGDQVAVYVAESYRCGIVLIARNGQLIDGGTSVSQFVMSQLGECLLFTYTGSSYGWQSRPIHSKVPRKAYYSQAAGNLTLATNWATLHNSTLSYAAWVRTPVATGTQYLIRASNPSSPFQGWEVTINAGVLQFYDGGTSRSSGFNIADNEWHHIAIIYNAGTSVSFYVDGMFITFTSASTFTSFSGDKFIGASSGGASRLYGSLDDQRIYYAGLTEADIDLLYNGGDGALSEATSIKANMSSWFKFDGTNYYDFVRGYAATVDGTLRSPVVSKIQAS